MLPVAVDVEGELQPVVTVSVRPGSLRRVRRPGRDAKVLFVALRDLLAYSGHVLVAREYDAGTVQISPGVLLVLEPPERMVNHDNVLDVVNPVEDVLVAAEDHLVLGVALVADEDA